MRAQANASQGFTLASRGRSEIESAVAATSAMAADVQRVRPTANHSACSMSVATIPQPFTSHASGALGVVRRAKRPATASFDLYI